jgi:DNA-directed RNA polymerase subunit RPC12/RpoP
MAKATHPTTSTKRVFCTQCNGENEVSPKAMSVVCQHCRGRLILENYRITTYHAVRLFATCGDILVEQRGFVSAPIRVQNLTVKGKVQGDVQARGRVTVDTTGQLRGSITAPRLIVHQGGSIQAFCRIGAIPPNDASAS